MRTALASEQIEPVLSMMFADSLGTLYDSPRSESDWQTFYNRVDFLTQIAITNRSLAGHTGSVGVHANVVMSNIQNKTELLRRMPLDDRNAFLTQIGS